MLKLIRGLDIFNHLNISLNEESCEFNIAYINKDISKYTITRSFNKGEEISYQYNLLLPNRLLLGTYGFIIKNNKIQVAIIELEFKLSKFNNSKQTLLYYIISHFKNKFPTTLYIDIKPGTMSKFKNHPLFLLDALFTIYKRNYQIMALTKLYMIKDLSDPFLYDKLIENKPISLEVDLISIILILMRIKKTLGLKKQTTVDILKTIQITRNYYNYLSERSKLTKNDITNYKKREMIYHVNLEEHHILNKNINWYVDDIRKIFADQFLRIKNNLIA